MINDHQLLETVLKKYGWTSQPLFNGKASIWNPEDPMTGAESTILIPTDPTAPDYEVLLQSATTKCVQLLGSRFTADLTYENSLVEHLMDPLEMHRSIDADSGFIPWGMGQTAYKSLTEILSAGARAALATKRVYHSSGYVIANSIMGDALMGQTRIGSYIITALIPSRHSFAASTTQDQKKSPETIPGRAITKKIVSALSAIQSGVAEVISRHNDDDDDTALQVFDPLVQEGVSYEMVDALSLLDEGESDISVSYRNSDRLNQLESFSFTLEPPMIPVLERVGRYLSKPQEPRTALVTGEVVQLSNSEDQPRHEIKLLAPVDKKMKSISVKLSEEQYNHAIEAHGNERLLSLHGVIEFQHGGSSIIDPDMVKVTDIPVGGFDTNVQEAPYQPTFDTPE